MSELSTEIQQNLADIQKKLANNTVLTDEDLSFLLLTSLLESEAQ
jgi:hypothetical protein